MPENNAAVSIRAMQAGEEAAASRMVTQVFDEFVAPGFSNQGRDEYYKFAAPDAMVERREQGERTFLAICGDEIIGLLSIRKPCHLSLLFVRGAHQGRGIARRLLGEAKEMCGLAGYITVNSAPNAVAAYQKMGFQATSPEQELNGIRFVAMKLDLRT